jgi:Flp pilus assembly pilin Flp
MARIHTFVHRIADIARHDESGQTMAEYSVVLALVAVIVVAALTFLTGGIDGVLSSVGSSLS